MSDRKNKLEKLWLCCWLCICGCILCLFASIFVLVRIAGRALWQRLTFAAGATFLPPRPVLQGQRPAGSSAHNCCTYLHKCFTTQELHIIRYSWTYTKLHRRAPSRDYYTLPVCAAQQPNYPLQRNIALKTLPSEILPGLGSLTIYIFRLSGWLFLQKWERKSWKKNETVAQISGRRCMTLAEVWPSFPDEGGAVQLSTLGGRGKSR